MGRWWSRFGLINQFRLEQVIMENYRVMVPADSNDTAVVPNNIPYLRGIYPETPTWYNHHFFPVAVPFPMPLVIFYFHNRIREATGRERDFWDRIIQLEVALLYAAGWFNEAARGRRGYVLPPETITWMRERIGDTPIQVGGGPGGMDIRFTAIARLMENVRAQDAVHRNTVRFPRQHLEDSTFIWTQLETGFVDTVTPGGRLLEPLRGGRLHFVDTRNGPARINFHHDNNEDYTPRPAVNFRVRFRDYDAVVDEEPPRQRRRTDQEFRFNDQPPTPQNNMRSQYNDNVGPRFYPNQEQDMRSQYNNNGPGFNPFREQDMRSHRNDYIQPQNRQEASYLQARYGHLYQSERRNNGEDDRELLPGESRREGRERRQAEIDQRQRAHLENRRQSTHQTVEEYLEYRRQQDERQQRVRDEAAAAQRQNNQAANASNKNGRYQYRSLFGTGKIAKGPTRAQVEERERERLAQLDPRFAVHEERRRQAEYDEEYRLRMRDHRRTGSGYGSRRTPPRNLPDYNPASDDEDEPVFQGPCSHHDYLSRFRRGPGGDGSGPPGIC